jgi:hypothetical protein
MIVQRRRVGRYLRPGLGAVVIARVGTIHAALAADIELVPGSITTSEAMLRPNSARGRGHARIRQPGVHRIAFGLWPWHRSHPCPPEPRALQSIAIARLFLCAQRAVG